MRAAAFVVILTIALAGLIASEHQQQNEGLPLVNSGFLPGHTEVIPWVLNTRCGIDSKNLPHRNPEHQV